MVLHYYTEVIPKLYYFIVHKQYRNGITLLYISYSKVVLLYYTNHDVFIPQLRVVLSLKLIVRIGARYGAEIRETHRRRISGEVWRARCTRVFRMPDGAYLAGSPRQTETANSRIGSHAQNLVCQSTYPS